MICLASALVFRFDVMQERAADIESTKQLLKRDKLDDVTARLEYVWQVRIDKIGLYLLHAWGQD